MLESDKLSVRTPEYYEGFEPFRDGLSFDQITRIIQQQVRLDLSKVKCLDSMAGTGIVGRTMRGRFPGMRVVFQDTSRNMLNFDAYDTEDVRILCDSRSLMFPDEAFDIVICRSGMNNLPKADYPKVLREFNRVMKYGGIGILQDHFATSIEEQTVINQVETKVAGIEGRIDKTYVPTVEELNGLIGESGGSIVGEGYFELRFSMKDRFFQKRIINPDLSAIAEILQGQSVIQYEIAEDDLAPTYPGVTMAFRK